MKATKRVRLFIGSGEAEKRGKKIAKEFETMGYRVIVVPISEEGVLELSFGGYVYRGHKIDLIEEYLSKRNNTERQCAIATT